jgi:Ca-activated chloride channel family protein
MKKHLWPAGFNRLCLLFVLLTTIALAQDTTFRIDVRLVRILATVKDAAGQLVGTLEKEDFTVLDNGVPQQIGLFERRTEQPLSIALMVDTSASTGKELKYELESVNRFLRAFFGEGNPKDAVALYSFNYDVTKLNHFTHNHGPLEHSLKLLKPEGGTSLYDAIYLASQDLDGRGGRRVIVVVTDGGDTTSSENFDGALQAAQMADAVIYSVLVMPITNDAGRNIGGENALTTMGARTGGRVFAPSIGPALDRAFSDILKELRTQYLIGFYPKDVAPTKNRFHHLDVRVRNPDLRVLARNGYYEDKQQEK